MTPANDRTTHDYEGQAGQNGDVRGPWARHQTGHSPRKGQAGDRQQDEERTSIVAADDPYQREDRSQVDRNSSSKQRRGPVPAGRVQRRLKIEVDRSRMVPSKPRVRSGQEFAASRQFGTKLGNRQVRTGDDRWHFTSCDHHGDHHERSDDERNKNAALAWTIVHSPPAPAHLWDVKRSENAGAAPTRFAAKPPAAGGAPIASPRGRRRRRRQRPQQARSSTAPAGGRPAR